MRLVRLYVMELEELRTEQVFLLCVRKHLMCAYCIAYLLLFAIHLIIHFEGICVERDHPTPATAAYMYYLRCSCRAHFLQPSTLARHVPISVHSG